MNLDLCAQLRPFAPADAAAVARMQTVACREQWTVSAADLLAQSGTRWVADAQELLASAWLSPFGAGAEDALRLSLCGDAAHFSRLYLAALSGGDLRGFTRVLGVVREDWVEQVAWFQAAGFANVWQSFGAHLDLGGFSLDRFALGLEQLYLDGYEVREWTPADDQHSLDELYALHLQFTDDAPATPATASEHLSRDEFAAKLREWRTWVLWRGREAVAYTSVHFPDGQPDSAGTVTRRSERGRGLATALKAYALDQLRQQGFTQASTGGAVTNLPMLRVNLRLGYRPEPLWLTFERRL
ncbi:GNAT family N-acetyltransferase [Deinococcus piscis]|uniref:GNAT family N-acetyltransferase n=1 Tax=Deinococcus piscis TaxID=394230 RepID=A0ABQ3K0Q4_9DEIO|nr:GNAT family N-acetyltransferase [Deinococcus piscis]GHF95332.1 GNAT family N-acetyltransferase [Deinococcus piscis]